MLISKFFIRKIKRFTPNFFTRLFNAIIKLFNDFKRVVGELRIFSA
ncbi:hypothetical protein HPOKI673_04475 [Helicobacter pylori oki673]|nr:hypothetical protein HPOKI673_04475 [Helicobacter pylori oki673]